MGLYKGLSFLANISILFYSNGLDGLGSKEFTASSRDGLSFHMVLERIEESMSGALVRDLARTSTVYI